MLNVLIPYILAVALIVIYILALRWRKTCLKTLTATPDSEACLTEVHRELKPLCIGLTVLSGLFFVGAILLREFTQYATESLVVLGMCIAAEVAEMSYLIWNYYRRVLPSFSDERRSIVIKLMLAILLATVFQIAGNVVLFLMSKTIMENTRYLLE